MTERQTIAYANPVWRAPETWNPRFFRLAGGMSTILSVNKLKSDFAGGRPVWHVSVALRNARGIVPLWRWDSRRRAEARGAAVAHLRGVGQGEDFWKDGDSCLHLRRQLSDAEVEGLPAEWLALPAIDEAG